MFLPSGIYWVGAAPILNVSGASNSSHYWHQYTADSDAAPAKAKDPGGWFYSFTATTTWKDLAATHLAFTVNGTSVNPNYPKFESATAAPSNIAFNDQQSSALVAVSVTATDLNKGIQSIYVKLKGKNRIA